MTNKIIEGISKKLDQGFKDVNIYTEQMKQGFLEPCFFIQFVSSSQKQVVGNRYFNSLALDVVYFPKSGEKAECFAVADQLNDVLTYVSLDDSLVRGTESSTEVADDVLHFLINYNFYVRKVLPDENGMEKLEIIGGLKGE